MKFAAYFMVIMVALLHLWFLLLEMFLWKKPIGLKAFQNSPEKAEITEILAANQGLYNGFLAVGLLTSFLFSNPDQTFAFQIFFLSCVIVAGTYGAWSFNHRILFIQAFPAAVAILLVFWSSA